MGVDRYVYHGTFFEVRVPLVRRERPHEHSFPEGAKFCPMCGRPTSARIFYHAVDYAGHAFDDIDDSVVFQERGEDVEVQIVTSNRSGNYLDWGESTTQEDVRAREVDDPWYDDAERRLRAWAAKNGLSPDIVQRRFGAFAWLS